MYSIEENISPCFTNESSPCFTNESSPCFTNCIVLSPVHVLQMSPVQVLQVQSSPGFTTCHLDRGPKVLFFENKPRIGAIIVELE